MIGRIFRNAMCLMAAFKKSANLIPCKHGFGCGRWHRSGGLAMAGGMTRKKREALHDGLVETLSALIPESWCATDADGVTADDLRLLQRGSVVFGRVVKAKRVIEQECHASTALAWLTDPTMRVFAGFGYCGELMRWDYHSFAVDSKDRIVEPTPLKRDVYFGAELVGDAILSFVREELDNLAALGIDGHGLWEKRTVRSKGAAKGNARGSAPKRRM